MFRRPRSLGALVGPGFLVLAPAFVTASCAHSSAPPRCSSTTAPISSGPSASSQPSSANDVAAVTSAARATLGGVTSVTLRLPAARFLGGSCSTYSGTGTFDLATSTGSVALTATSVGSPAAGTTTFAFGLSALYVHLNPTQARLLPAGRSWVHAPFTGIESDEAAVQSFFIETMSLDPEMILQELAGATSQASVAGNGPAGEGVSGMPRAVGSATYSVVIELQQSALPATGPPAPAFRLAMKQQIARSTSLSSLGGSMSIAATVTLARDGTVSAVSFAPPSTNLGIATFTFTPAPSSRTMTPPASTDTVELKDFLKLGPEGNESGKSTSG